MHEPDRDDSLCAHCGKNLPEHPEPGTPSDEGYCDDECKAGTRPVIVSALALALHLGVADGPNDRDSVGKRIARRLYKDTECGIGFYLSEHLDYVSVHGYCEGDVGDCPNHVLHFPFRAEDFDAAVTAADCDGCALWGETHGCPACYGGADYNPDGNNPVDPECPTCGGAGVVL